MTLGSSVEGLTFGQFLDRSALRNSDLPAMVASDHSSGEPRLLRWTYAELGRDVQALQWELADLGVKPGEPVGVLLSSFPEWVLFLFAITRLGATFVPINPRFRTRELNHVLSHSESRTLIGMGRYLGHDYTSIIAEVLGARGPDGRFAHLPLLERIIGVGSRPHPDALDAAEMLARGRIKLDERGPPPCYDNPQGVAILFYTSGTTAFPKGVPLTHANLLPHSVGCGELLHIQPGEKVLSLYPFFGISGGANKVLSTLGLGACLVFQDAFRAEEAYDLLQAEDCTVVHAVDVQIRELIAVARARGDVSKSERRGTIAFMASLDEGLARDMGPVLGLNRFVHPYGMTETNPMILRNALDDPFEAAVRPGGRIAPRVQLKILDPRTGEEQKPDEPGEIVVRGETVTAGYLRDPDANAAAFKDGWFRTGDLGVKTSDGFVFYVGRSKDMLKIGGFNVAPQELESVLRAHSAVEDVAVTGAPDVRLGEVAAAFVKLRRDASATEEELRDYCKQQVANFKVPRHIYFVETLPYHTAANGSKLQRHVLREWAKERSAARASA
jgi:fatty-acyl-CoA synthase